MLKSRRVCHHDWNVVRGITLLLTAVFMKLLLKNNRHRIHEFFIGPYLILHYIRYNVENVEKTFTFHQL